MSEPAQMPRPSQYKPLKDVRTIDEAIDHPDVIRRFQNALGTQRDAVQYLATIRSLRTENPDIGKADIWELIRCALDLAELGLRPNTPLGHAWIIARVKNRGKQNEQVSLSVQVGYQGMLELAYRAGTLESIHADVVYEDDDFTYEYGTNAHLRHVPRGARRDRNATHAYCHAKLSGGGQAFVVWAYSDVLEIRNGSDAYKYALSCKGKAGQEYVWDACVWVKYEYQQSRKTILKQLLKDLPRSSEMLMKAAYIDNIAEAGRASYAGIAGDIRSGMRELTHQPGATLHDFGFRTPTMEGQAEPVTTQTQGPKAPARPAQAKSAPSQPETNRSPQPAGDPRFDREPELESQLFPNEQKAAEAIMLISADGEILLNAINLVDWAKEFVDHWKDVPHDMKQAYEEINWQAIQDAIEHPDTHAIMAQADYGPAGSEPQNEAPVASFVAVQIPTGRITEEQIAKVYAESLAEVLRPEDMPGWRKVNEAGLEGLPTRAKLAAYKELGLRSRALGILLPNEK